MNERSHDQSMIANHRAVTHESRNHAVCADPYTVTDKDCIQQSSVTIDNADNAVKAYVTIIINGNIISYLSALLYDNV